LNSGIRLVDCRKRVGVKDNEWK